MKRFLTGAAVTSLLAFGLAAGGCEGYDSPSDSPAADQTPTTSPQNQPGQQQNGPGGAPAQPGGQESPGSP